jgi:transketolase
MARTYPAMEPLAEKWRAFGWSVQELDGHDVEALTAALAAVPFEPGRPSAIIARTVKGKGVSFMENDLEWHYRPPNDQDLKRALLEISG